MFRRVVLAATLAAAAVAAVPALTQPAAAATGHRPGAHRVAARRTTLTGTYRLLAADGRNESAGADEHYEQLLVSGAQAYRLTLQRGQHLRPGQRVSVSGMFDGRTLAADTVSTENVAAPTVATGTPATRRRVLVILASWTAPDSVTPASAAAQVFGDGDGWEREVSYGAVGITGDVTPWVSIAGPDLGLCYTNHRQVMAQAKAAALLAGYDATAYDRTIVYFPRSTNPDCSGYGGWAYQPGTEVWLNGSMDRRSTMHEQGHAEGLPHAGSLLCVDNTGNPVTLAATGCTRSDYGDPSDAMGASAYVGHYSAPQKSRLGWLGTTADLSAGGSATLAPYEAAGTAARAATVSTGTGRTYWLEYRTALGADAALTAGNVGGVLVHMTDPTVSPAPVLLDMTPDNDFTDAALRPGSSWTTPEGLVITAGAAASYGMAVTVARGSAPLAPLAVTATPGDGTATATWTPGGDGGSPVTAYVVTASPGGVSATVAAGARSASLAGLVDGTPYTLSVRAVNALGAGAPTASQPVVPVDVVAPGPVQLLGATYKKDTVTLTWSRPVDLDFSGVTVRMADGTTPPATPGAGSAVYTGTATTTVVSGLANKDSVSFSVFPRDEVPNWGRGAWVKVVKGKVTAGLL
jgi:hypothetical protein